MLGFSIIATFVMIVINLFTYVCFLSRVEFFKKYRWIIAILLVLTTILEAFYFNSLRRQSDNVFAIQFSASLVGISFLLFTSSVIYLVFRVPLEVIHFDEKRRRVLKYFLDVTIFIMAISWIISGLFGGFKEPKITNIKVNIKNLRRSLTIAQMSDIHIGKVLGREFMQLCVDKINSLDADIVVITGDLVDLEISVAKEKLEPLKNLESRYGVYYVLGNHEYFHGVEKIVQYLESINIIVLKNSSVVIDESLNLAGIYDMSGKRFGFLKPDVKKAISDIDDSLPTILLSHQPKVVNDLNGDENIDLILSGHTHGGQIFPFGLLVLMDQPYLYGLYNHNEKTQIYVSSGAGYWGPPLRIFAPSEIVKITLQPN